MLITNERFPHRLTISLLLALATVLLFAQVGEHEFLSYDDNLYITDNQTVQGGLSWSNVAWAFTTMHAANWHPLTWLSLMLDIQLFGPRPGALHLVNVLFHAINAILLFLILARMTGAQWRSAFVAALFAMHPLHVESVAWAAERKDVLSGLFGLLAIWAYLRYADRPGVRRYAWVVLFLVLGLLSKPMLVTLPFLLLLLDYWPLGRIGGSLQPLPGSVPARQQASLIRVLAEKAPLLVLCAASSVVTVAAQKRNDALADLSLTLGDRLANAAVGYVRYLGKTLWPGSLSVIYPHPGTALPMWQSAGAVIFLLLITSLVLLQLRRSPWLAIGWFWFIGMLVPVIGLVQVGAQSIADRYTYLPLIGVFMMIAWEAPERLKQWGVPLKALAASSMLVLVILAGLTWRQAGFWQNHETLFRHALRMTTNNCVALNSLADYLSRKGNVDEAYVDLREAVRLCPKDEQAWYNLGVLQKNRGELFEAERSLRETVHLKPGSPKAWSNLGAVFLASGRVPEAIDALREAAQHAPGDASIQFNLGAVYGKTGRFPEAIEAYQEAVRLKPDFAAAWNNLGIAYRSLGRISEAAAAFRQAAQIRSDDPLAWYNLGILYARSGEFADAVDAFRASTQLGPDRAASWYQLGLAYSSLGRQQEALDVVRTLRQIDAGLAEDLMRQVNRLR